MIEENNMIKLFSAKKNLNNKIDEYRFFKIPSYIYSKVPRHW